MLSRRAVLSLAVMLLGVVVSAAGWAQDRHLQTAELTVATAEGPQRFVVELAMTPEQMERGLMFRNSLPPNAGMLFDFKEPTLATMWMKNTLIPLDMLFVDEHGRIVNIHERAIPESLDLIVAAAPVRAVIELNGGAASRLGIKPGDRVIFPIFGEGH